MNLYRNLILKALLLIKGNNKLEILEQLNKNIKLDYATIKEFQFQEILKNLSLIQKF